MIFDTKSSNYILPTNDNAIKRMTIFSFTLASWWMSEHFLRPLCGGFLQSIRVQLGNGAFVQNLISQSLPVDLTCLILFAFFYKIGVIPAPRFGRQWKLIFREGFAWGLLICIPTAILALNMGYRLGFAPNWQSILGNVISNSYEEFTYRIFLFSVAAYTFKRVWAGVLISSILFAAIHSQYPISMQIVVIFAAIFFSSAYIRSSSIYAAVLSHQLADAILDSILIR